MIIYKLRDPDRAPALATHFESLFHHETESWQDREEGNLQLFLTIRLSAAITVSLIILLAGFGIFNVLTMSVLSKVREIAILRSIGYRRGDISRDFSLAGRDDRRRGLGHRLRRRRASHLGGFAHPDPRARTALRGPFFGRVGLAALSLGTLLAMIAVAIASYVPARRAALLQPVATLRGSSV